MSTISTQLNWGASYLVNDLYLRFMRPAASDRELVRVGRLATGALMLASLLVTYFMTSIEGAWRFLMALGAGTGLVLILRWYWWRINAWAELAAMLAGFVVGLLTSIDNPIYSLRIDDFGLRLMATAGITFAIWVPVMLLTKPESDEKLDAFYRRVRPGGPGWRRQRGRTGLPPAQDLGKDLLRVCAGMLLLYGLMFGVGGIVLGRFGVGAVNLAIALGGFLWLRWLGPQQIAPAMPEPATHPS
jgi:hypothetical protein